MCIFVGRWCSQPISDQSATLSALIRRGRPLRERLERDSRRDAILVRSGQRRQDDRIRRVRSHLTPRRGGKMDLFDGERFVFVLQEQNQHRPS